MKETEKDEASMSFWEHLDVFRESLIRILAAMVACGIAAFIAKEWLFEIILAPQRADFPTYLWLERINLSGIDNQDTTQFTTQLINTGLSGQFVIHMKTSMYAGIILSSPYTLYQLFRFIAPALYENERKYMLRTACSGYLMFLAGILLCYFLIFPLTFRFLATYQVSADVPNLINLESYVNTLITMSLLMGLVFELPVVSWLLARLGALKATYMRKFRRHAIVAILLVAAIITPTSDVFTLLIVSLPIWLLYEASIWIVRKTESSRYKP